MGGSLAARKALDRPEAARFFIDLDVPLTVQLHLAGYLYCVAFRHWIEAGDLTRPVGGSGRGIASTMQAVSSSDWYRVRDPLGPAPFDITHYDLVTLHKRTPSSRPVVFRDPPSAIA